MRSISKPSFSLDPRFAPSSRSWSKRSASDRGLRPPLVKGIVLNKLNVALDIDGFLASFNASFINLIKEKTGHQLPPESDSYPPVWNYHVQPDGPLTKEEALEMFQVHIGQSHNFWLKLQPYPEGERIMKALSAIETVHDIYFITDRIGASAKFQTEAWLMKWFTLPTVIIARDKAPVIKALNIDLYVDDKPENCNAAVEATDGKTVVLMPDRPYNRNIITDYRVKKVKDVEKVLGQMLGFGENVPLGRLVA